VQVIDPASDARVAQYAAQYQDGSEADVRASGSLLAALMVKAGDADAMLCGLVATTTATWPMWKR
jgi:malate dehydrogenase (oxaloacetate-decarboxylating)(NADP+)